MSDARMTESEARALLDARLGRTPQDALEAAVVLEAWGGVPGSSVFELASAALDSGAALNEPGSSRRRTADEQRHPLADLFALLVAIVAVATWTVPLARELGADAVHTALVVALPGGLAFQWMVRARYFCSEGGLQVLARHGSVLVAALQALVLLPSVEGGGAFSLAAMLAGAWISGAILAQRRLGLAYAFVVAAVAVALHLGTAPFATLQVANLVLVAGVVVSLPRAVGDGSAWLSLGRRLFAGALGALGLFAAAWSGQAAAFALPMLWLAIVLSGSRHADGSVLHRRTLLAGLLGGSVGAALVLDHSIGWGSGGAAPALALLPATAGSFWAGWRLSCMRTTLLDMLHGSSHVMGDVRTHRNPAVRLLFESLFRLVIGATLLSALLVAAARELDFTTAPWTLLLAFALLSCLALLVSLLEGLESGRAALLCVAVALGVEIAVGFSRAPFSGAGASLAAAAGVVFGLVPLVYRLQTPGRLLGTRLLIR